MSKQWYVIQAYSNLEKKALESLQERIDRSELRDQFGEVLMPTEEVIEMKGQKKRHFERKLFPGYILVEMNCNDETWRLVKGTPLIIGFLGGENPGPLNPSEFNHIMQRVQDGVQAEMPKELYEVGEEIRVVHGPFNDFSGIVEAVNYEKSRLQVAVTIFGRATPVDLAFGQVEKI